MKKIGIALCLFVIVLVYMLIYGSPAFNIHDQSYKKESIISELNHANTYYSFGRYKQNTLPELEKAGEIANHALSRVKAELITGKIDSTSALDLINTTDNIIKSIHAQMEICIQNLNSRIPFFMEMMHFDKSFKEEYEPTAHMGNKTASLALEKLIQMTPPGRFSTLEKTPFFSVVQLDKNDDEIKEASLQILNSNTNHYVISNHELSSASGINDIKNIKADSIVLLKSLCKRFNTNEIGIFKILENDRYNGIYYYGARFSIFNNTNGLIAPVLYTEAFILDRTFNQILLFKLPLLILFFILAYILNLLLNKTDDKRIYDFLLPLVLAITTVFYIIVVDYALAQYFCPLPNEFHETNKAGEWRCLITICLTLLPAIVAYLSLGKLDIYFKKFNSELANLKTLQSINLGTCMMILLIFSYFSILRYGFSSELLNLIPLALGLFILSIPAANYLHTVIGFPQKVRTYHKIKTWTLLTICLLGIYLLVYNNLGFWNFDNSIRSLIYCAVIPFSLINILKHPKIEAYVFKLFFTSKSKEDESKFRFIPPYNFNYKILAENGSIWIKSSGENKQRTLIIEGGEGSGKSACLQNLIKEAESGLRSFVIDCSKKQTNASIKEDGLVHYYPFAIAFAELLSFRQFNHKTETAKKATNLIGKTLDGITSMGGLLLDEKAAERENPDTVAQDIIEQLYKLEKPLFVVAFENIHALDSECEALFISMLIKLQKFPEKSIQIFTCYSLFSKKEFYNKLIQTQENINSNALPQSFRISIRYENIIRDMIFSLDHLPIHIRIRLKDLFEKEEKNASPKIIREILDKLIASKTLPSIESEGNWPDGSKIASLPQVNIDTNSILISLKQKEVEILIAAAYSSDPQGQFRLSMLQKFVPEIDLTELLYILKDFSNQNIIVDLIDKDDLFCFVDYSYTLQLKDPENLKPNEVNKLSKNYYKIYINYFVHGLFPQEGNFRNNLYILLENQLRKASISIDELVYLAQRSYVLSHENPELAYELCLFTARKLTDKIISRLAEADELLESATTLIQSHPELYQQNSFLPLKTLKLKVMLDEGKSNKEILDLIMEIEAERNKFPEIEFDTTDFLLDKITYQFRNYDATDIEEGLKYCKKIINGEINNNPSIPDSKNEVRILRAEFYQLQFERINKENPELTYKNCIDVLIPKYKAVAEKVKAKYDRCKDSEAKNLLGEIYNDLGGKIYSDKVVAFARDSKNSNIIKHDCGYYIQEGLTYLEKRLNLEGFEINLRSDAKEILSNLELKLNTANLSIDKKGLCYTFNYLLRFYSYIGDNQKAGRFADYAVYFNSLTNDEAGLIMAYSIYGDLLLTENKAEESFIKKEISYGYAFKTKNARSIDFAITGMKKAINKMAKSQTKSDFEKRLNRYEQNA